MKKRPDPEHLARDIERGVAEAEHTFVEWYGKALRVQLKHWTRDSSDAEDLYQEAFHLALAKVRRGELRHRERLPGFLASLARNLSIQHYRAAGARLRATTPLEEGGHRADSRDGPLDVLLRIERSARLRRALGELENPRDREVLTRYYLAEDDSATICAELAISRSHFKRVLFRARRRLREAYTRSSR